MKEGVGALGVAGAKVARLCLLCTSQVLNACVRSTLPGAEAPQPTRCVMNFTTIWYSDQGCAIPVFSAIPELQELVIQSPIRRFFFSNSGIAGICYVFSQFFPDFFSDFFFRFFSIFYSFIF